MQVVAFDESGNSGPNLLDPMQPVYTLASVCVDPTEATLLLDRVRGHQAPEVHYSRMRRRPAGRDGILEVLTSELLVANPPCVSAVDKQYMIIGKLVDEMLEPAFAGRRKNIYADEGHLVITNLFHSDGRKVCGVERWDRLLQAFVTAIRRPTGESVRELRRSLFACKKAAVDRPDIAGFLGIAASEEGGWRLLLEMPEAFRDSLDPAPTFLGQQLDAWGDRLGKRYRAIHDDSAVVARWKPLYERLMNQAQPVPAARFGHRKLVGGLSAVSLELATSDQAPLVQIADVVAGAAAEWTGASLSGGPRDPFVDALGRTKLPTWMQWWFWPPATPPLTAPF